MMCRVERLAVIDMGSNSWRLVVYGYDPGAWWKLTDEIREAVRVGEALGDDLTLKPEPMERALHTAAVFASFCRAAGVEEVIPVATSAIRDAVNSDELLGAIRERAGLEVRVLSGAEEAWYGYLAVANSTTLVNGFGLDMGGGSIQPLQVRDRRLAGAESLPLGAVRMTEAFLPDEEATPKQVKALRRHVADELEALDWFTAGETPRLVGIGGTIRNLAVAAQKRAGLPDTGPQGHVLSGDELEDIVETLASKPASKRASVPGIRPDRGDVILAGALVLAAAMEQGGFQSMEVTDAGLREGVFFERFLSGVEPPLLDDVRRRSVESLAAQFHPEPRHVEHVARLSLEIYDGLAAAGLTKATALDRELLWAACMLHDIGVAIDYDDHHKHSEYLILNAGLPGFMPREVILVALIARYHRKGDPDASPLGGLARKGDEARLALLSGVIRLAEQLERSRDQSVHSVRLVPADGRVRVEAAAAGDATVPIWAASRNADLLGRAIDREVEVVPAA
jgi:exopolyphosphatase/guanosine-5'-triphosphate,3'-diphosphate pyrophosphatase